MEVFHRMVGIIRKGIEDRREGAVVPLQEFIVNDSYLWSPSSLPRSNVGKVGRKYRNWKQEQQEESNTIDTEIKEFKDEITRRVW